MGPLQLKRLKPNDRIWALLIDTLWKENSGLYFEKYLSDADPEDLKQIWLKNTISEIIDFGQTLGQDHVLEGNRSAAIGQGGHTTSFMELLLGAYPTLAVDQDPENWIPTDRLLAIGNGTGNEARSNVIEIFKSGLVKIYNSILIGEYSNLDIDPDEGSLQYTSIGGLQLYRNGAWSEVGIGGKLADRDILTNLISRSVAVDFKKEYPSIPVGRKNIHVYRLFEADVGKVVDQDVICYNLDVTTLGFTLTIDESEDLAGIIIEYEFNENTGFNSVPVISEFDSSDFDNTDFETT